MKLYEVPRGTKFRIKGDEDKTEFTLDHIDGMYSVCYYADGLKSLIHIVAYVEVEVIYD